MQVNAMYKLLIKLIILKSSVSELEILIHVVSLFGSSIIEFHLHGRAVS